VLRHVERQDCRYRHILASVEAVYELTTGADVALRQLVAAQESEVMARYGVHDAGPGLPEDAPCIIGRLGGRPVGCVALGRLDSRTGEVKRMYVDPAARGHRIGRLLLKQVEELGRFRSSRSHRGKPQGLELRTRRRNDGRIGFSGYDQCHGHRTAVRPAVVVMTAKWHERGTQPMPWAQRLPGETGIA